jgi:ribosomal-protein-alanine N-acetyltransferase
MTGNPRWVLRECRSEDLWRLHEIDRICFTPDIAYTRAELRFYLQHPGSIGRLAEQGGLIVGFVVGRTLGYGMGQVITLDVMPSARRQGVGRGLMEALHKEFAARGVELATLEVSVDNPAARSLYEGMGYRLEQLLTGYYGGRTDACRMVCRLVRVPQHPDPQPRMKSR